MACCQFCSGLELLAVSSLELIATKYIYNHFMVNIQVNLLCLQCFDAVGWVAGRASGLYKTEWWGAGMVICLE